MFEKKIEKIISSKLEILKNELQVLMTDKLEVSKTSIMAGLQSHLEEILKSLLQDEKFLDKMGEKLEEAEAARLAKNTELKIEELSKKEKKMYKSKVPWIDVESMGEEDGNMKLRLAWNPAFIEFLKKNGFTGEDEDAMVQHYLGRLNLDILLEDVEESMSEHM